MAKGRKRKKPAQFHMDADTPTPEQIRQGGFRRDFVTHAETATKAMAYRRESSIAARWIDDENNAFASGSVREADRLFPVPAQKFMADCLTLWARLPENSLSAQYGERTGASAANGRDLRSDALTALSRYREMLGPYQKHYWPVFENVLRWNEPAGVAGSRFGNNPTQRIQSAKLIVSNVACTLAGKLGY